MQTTVTELKAPETADVAKAKIRLAPYCWVSSPPEDQLHSFAAQIRHYPRNRSLPFPRPVSCSTPGHVEQRDFCDALSISSAEYALIDHPERGVCLYHCGNARYLLQVQAPDFQAKLFGDAGGR